MKRGWLGLLVAGALVVMGSALADVAKADSAKDLRIGYQKYGTLTLLKARGTLDKQLAEQGVSVSWIEFPGGPQLLEALNVGSVDFGTTGEAPPVFAQAAGAPLLYVGYEPPSPVAEAILVPKDSPIHTVAELRGRTVALNKGSNVHYLLVRALEAAGLGYQDIQPVYLPPADGRAAFERGSVEAWVIWDPYLAAAQQATQGRILIDGSGLVSNHQFFLATRSYVADHPDLIKEVLEALGAVDQWAVSAPREVAEKLSPLVNISPDVLELAVRRSNYGLRPLDHATVVEQQKIADTFHDLGLIPRKIVIQDAVWPPNS
jgi:sulfonate transport system substrate-binding protein